MHSWMPLYLRTNQLFLSDLFFEADLKEEEKERKGKGEHVHFFLSFVIMFRCQRENVMKMPKKRAVASIAFAVFM